MTPDEEKAQRRLERLKFRIAHSIELIRATAAFEHAALRLPVILNSGALVAFLALIGALQGRNGNVALNNTAFVVAIVYGSPA